MSHRNVGVRYEGLAVEAHRMEVRHLAPSLLALDDLFTYAHFLTGGGYSQAPAVEVAALRWAVLRHRKGREHEVVPVQPGLIRVAWPDGTSFEAPKEAEVLVASADFNRTARRALEPLRSEGIDGVELGPRHC